jgi:ABC-2 type transport system permease protein
MVIPLESLSDDGASRLADVASPSTNPAFLMLYGPAYGASTGALGVWAAGATFWFVALASSMSVLRHTRVEDETGRRELLGATVVGRHSRLAAALLVTTAADLALALVAAVALTGWGLPVAGSIAFGLSLAAVGMLFAALAAVAAQVTVFASAARGLTAAGLGLAWLLRGRGCRGVDGPVRWLPWLSPLGWAPRIRPFAGERWELIALPVAVGVALVVVAVTLAARRDVGAGALRPRPGPPTAAPWMRSPLSLAWRLHRARMLAWSAGSALIGGVMATAAHSADELFTSNPGIARMFELVGAGSRPSEVFLSGIAGMLGPLAGGYAVSAML